MKLVQDSARLVGGHYQVALPLRNSCVNMLNNKKVAEQRALNLKRRFKRDSLFQQQYTDFMNGIFAKGYTEQVLSGELARSDERLWYIPHHGVYHPQKGKSVWFLTVQPLSSQHLSMLNCYKDWISLAHSLASWLDSGRNRW